MESPLMRFQGQNNPDDHIGAATKRWFPVFMTGAEGGMLSPDAP